VCPLPILYYNIDTSSLGLAHTLYPQFDHMEVHLHFHYTFSPRGSKFSIYDPLPPGIWGCSLNRFRQEQLYGPSGSERRVVGAYKWVEAYRCFTEVTVGHGERAAGMEGVQGYTCCYVQDSPGRMITFRNC
jgi:hypothetical protein